MEQIEANCMNIGLKQKIEPKPKQQHLRTEQDLATGTVYMNNNNQAYLTACNNNPRNKKKGYSPFNKSTFMLNEPTFLNNKVGLLFDSQVFQATVSNSLMYGECTKGDFI